MLSFQQFILHEGDVIPFRQKKSTSTSDASHPAAALKHPAVPGLLNRGDNVYVDTTHVLKDRTPQITYGKVIHHNKTDAHIQWEDGGTTKHNRKSYSTVSDKNNKSPKFSVNKVGSMSPTEHRTAYTKEYQNSYKIPSDHHDQHMNEIKGILTKAGLSHSVHRNSFEAVRAGAPQSVIRVHDHDHRKITKALEDKGWSSPFPQYGGNHSDNETFAHAKSTALGKNKITTRIHYSNNSIQKNSDGSVKKHENTPIGSVAAGMHVGGYAHGFNIPVISHASASSNVPGWKNKSVDLYVRTYGSKYSGPGYENPNHVATKAKLYADL